ncbi:hypothetical protein I3760_04G040600 [Carya illinoinensis]|nr:hypothetical protein I3760_04G040600 [Carya illinoinensis]
MRKLRETLKINLWYLSMEATTLLGVGLNTGFPSFLVVGLIAMPLACWVRVKVMHLLVLSLALSRTRVSSPPVLLGHSFGGLIIQYYIANLKKNQALEMETFYPKLAGAALVCSVPPSGNSGLVWRYVFSKPIAAFKVTRSLAAKAFQTSLPLCKETFFSSTMEDHLVLRYQELMRESSRMPLFDLRKLNAALPVPSVPKGSIDVLVLGATDDFIVDAEGLRETGRFYGVSPVSVEGVAHDMMLDCSWEKGAKAILSWLTALRK